MSRVGQVPITVPSGVEVSIEQGRISVRGPRGLLERSNPEGISVEKSDGEIRVG
ncbi:MAG: 50S ribosomal protein L6, partial [Actinomycetota bacterium]|nr:50S ribosomal protein L6 [Actinomycetota bacterium]